MIKSVLDADLQSRASGVISANGDLYTLQSINWNSMKTLDYSLPTLVKEQKEYSRTRVRNNEEFKVAFANKFPVLNRMFSSGMLNNVLIAGGCVSSLLMANRVNDIDMFLHSCTVEHANSFTESFVANYIKTKFELKKEKQRAELKKSQSHSHSQEYPEQKYSKKHTSQEDAESPSPDDYVELSTGVKVYRTPNAISFEIDEKIQIIFRIYLNISEILHGFDIGASAVGFDGTNVYFTSLSRFSYENQCNILDLTRRSTSYEYRLKKYFDQGFSIVLPDLDVSKLPCKNHRFNRDEICELPYFTFAYSRIKANSVTVTEFLKVAKVSDYGDDLDSCLEYSTFYQNLLNLSKDVKYLDRYYLLAYDDRHIDVKGKIEEDYLAKQSVEMARISPNLSIELINRYLNTFESRMLKGTIQLAPLKRLFTADELNQMLHCNAESSLERSVIEQVFAAKSQTLTEKFQKFVLDVPHQFIWLTEQPARQTSLVTGSIHYLPCNLTEWYGDYLKSFM